MSTTRKNSYIICGEAGTGKSFFIKQEAKKHNAKLFRWNVRVDRSLREGREILHQQVRSKEQLYVWIEGADDLTQEAQAFLRRILETSSSSVISMLEVREPWKLSPPIISRCIPININVTQSFRYQKNMNIANNYNLIEKNNIDITTLSIKDIVQLRKNAYDPIELIFLLANYYDYDYNYTEIIKKIGAGYSPWIQLTYFLAVIHRTKDTLI
jgi:replication-associated recombination protein RarA